MKKLIIKGMDNRYFPEKLGEWYLKNHRQLPWRATRDPYKIWLSEIILQQTRVNQGLPYYLRFVERFPTVKHLARATEQEVLRLWQGLGYYTRARNLHKCAQLVLINHNGHFPSSFRELLQLPGIGEYTAAAIASFAADERVAVVDGNVFRVLSRVFGIDKSINSPDGKKQFSSLATNLIANAQPAIHNQALMEFGAVHCTPKIPKCDTCIFNTSCFANAHSLQSRLPVKTRKKAARKRYFYYLVFERKKSLMMKKRSGNDIWKGLFDFHLVEKRRPVNASKLLQESGYQEWIKNADNVEVSRSYKHVLTHQIIFSRFIRIKTDRTIKPKVAESSFYSLKKIVSLPKPVLVSRFLNDQYLL